MGDQDEFTSTTDAAVAALEAAEDASLPVESESTPTDLGQQDDTQNSGGINPAWNSALSVVPSIYHDRLAEQFRAWDKAANDRITSVQSRYKPYEDFAANAVDPEMLKQSIELMRVFTNEPQAIYEFLHQQYGQGTPGQGQNDSGNEFDLGASEENDDPRLSNLEQQQQMILNQMQAAQAAQEQQQADLWLNDQQAQLTRKYAGTELNWDYILTTAMLKGQQGMTDNAQALAVAAEEWVGMVNKIRSTPPAGASAPRVMPAAGGVQRSNAVNIRELSDEQRRNLALEMLTTLDRE